MQDNNRVGGLALKFKTYHEVIMLLINVPHPFSIVLKRFYCSQEVLSKIPKPIENNRKWVWWVYNLYLDPSQTLYQTFPSSHSFRSILDFTLDFSIFTLVQIHLRLSIFVQIDLSSHSDFIIISKIYFIISSLILDNNTKLRC